MLSDKQILSHLEDMENELMKNENKKKVDLSNDWAKEFPDEPGVYVAFENRQVVYVGETGNLQCRMKDLRNTLNHSFRRNIGRVRFSHIRGYQDASSKKKFPQHVENKVENWLTTKIKISYLATELGRKELEERIFKRYSPVYNKKGRRIKN